MAGHLSPAAAAPRKMKFRLKRLAPHFTIGDSDQLGRDFLGFLVQLSSPGGHHRIDPKQNIASFDAVVIEQIDSLGCAAVSEQGIDADPGRDL